MSVDNKAQILDDRTYEPQPFNLAERMYGVPDHPNPDLRRGSCYVMGIKLIPNGTPAFDEAIQNWLRRMNHLTDEKIKELTTTLRQRTYFPESTNFKAFRYVNTDGRTSMADGMPYQGILTDMNWLSILYLDSSEMIILPFGDSRNGPHRKLFYDAIGAKGTSVRTLYTGSLADAITEFNQKQPFSFNLARFPVNAQESSQLMDQLLHDPDPKGRQINGLFTEMNVSFKRVLEVISLDPTLYSAPPYRQQS